jgi:hypothetical protein
MQWFRVRDLFLVKKKKFCLEEFVMVLLYYSDRSEASGGAAVLGPGVEDCARCAASLD